MSDNIGVDIAVGMALRNAMANNAEREDGNDADSESMPPLLLGLVLVTAIAFFSVFFVIGWGPDQGSPLAGLNPLGRTHHDVLGGVVFGVVATPLTVLAMGAICMAIGSILYGAGPLWGSLILAAVLCGGAALYWFVLREPPKAEERMNPNAVDFCPSSDGRYWYRCAQHQ